MKMFLFLAVFGLAACVLVENTAVAADSGAGWEVVSTDGLCSTGTAFQFYTKDSPSSDNLLVFFNGGGACWFGEACDLTSQPNIHSPFADMPQNNPQLMKGIFDFENPENPVAQFDIVYVPYCTGDVHLGAGPTEYRYKNSEGNEVAITAHHEGFKNSQTALQWTYENHPKPSRIVLAGSSAGAIGASFYAGLVAEHYRDVEVSLLGDAAGGYGSPLLSRTHSAWRTASILPPWPEYAGKTDQNLTFEDYYIASANHNANLTIAQYNAANDATQVMFTQVIGDKPGSFSLPQRLLNNYLRIESEVDQFYSYTAGGNVHMILQDDIFYQYEVEGTRFVDWFADLISGNSLRDVSCVSEAEGCEAAPQ